MRILKKVKVGLRPIVSQIYLPTVIKCATLPGENVERVFIATQVGEIFYIGKEGKLETFLDIKSSVLKLGENGDYDERGLLGLAFHPRFTNNGFFYIHYSIAGSKASGALPNSFIPNPCDANTLNLKWENRGVQYDHIDTIEEWYYRPNTQPQKRRTLLNIRSPFMNHNGVNSLNFSIENNKLIFTNGDGGLAYDPFNLSQNDMEIHGKIIEIDVEQNTFIQIPPVVSRFDELPSLIQNMLALVAKGVRNSTGISFQKINNQTIKYIGNVGQDLVEAVYTFIDYQSIPITQLVNGQYQSDSLINFGWRSWEGNFPTTVIGSCNENPEIGNLMVAYYDEAIQVSPKRINPLVCYYHFDNRQNSFVGKAITGVHPYVGTKLPELTNKIIFCDFLNGNPKDNLVGILAYTNQKLDGKKNDFGIIEVDYNFKHNAFYISLGTNQNQTKIYLGTFESANVGDGKLGTVFEIVPTNN